MKRRASLVILACGLVAAACGGEASGTADTQAPEQDVVSEVDITVPGCSPNCPLPTGAKWISIPGGTFEMGCSPGDLLCEEGEKPAHTVTLSAFEMLETEVTEAQYLAVMGDDPSCDYGSGGGPDSPVECLTWKQTRAFCEAVGGRLPTEAEWEYAARAGATTKYSCGDDPSCLGDIAWYDENSGGHKHDVKGKDPNGYGLHDMLGNIWEWTGDWYSDTYYSKSPASNPQGPSGGSGRVVRGGHFDYPYFGLSVSGRTPGPSSGFEYGSYIGGRCARSVEP
jgi:formylglycine-generating enzyme required for sulfatase activity